MIAGVNDVYYNLLIAFTYNKLVTTSYSYFLYQFLTFSCTQVPQVTLFLLPSKNPSLSSLAFLRKKVRYDGFPLLHGFSRGEAERMAIRQTQKRGRPATPSKFYVSERRII